MEWVWSPPEVDAAEGEEPAGEPTVESGEIVIKLRGVEAMERKVARLDKDIARYQERYDKALEAGEKDKAQAAEDKLGEKQGELEEVKEAMSAFVVVAPKAGVFTPTVKKGDKIEGEAVLGMVSGEPVRSASISLPDGVGVAEGDDIEVAAKASPDSAVVCKVGAADGGTIEVLCAGDLEPGPVVFPKILVEE